MHFFCLVMISGLYLSLDTYQTVLKQNTDQLSIPTTFGTTKRTKKLQITRSKSNLTQIGRQLVQMKHRTVVITEYGSLVGIEHEAEPPGKQEMTMSEMRKWEKGEIRALNPGQKISFAHCSSCSSNNNNNPIRAIWNPSILFGLASVVLFPFPFSHHFVG